MRITFPGYHYIEALIAAKLSRLNERRLEICQNVSAKISEPGSRLHHLLPPTREQENFVTVLILLCQNPVQLGIKKLLSGNGIHVM